MMYTEAPPLRGNLTENEPLSRHTSWRVGGTARQYYQPADMDDLCCYLQHLEQETPMLWVGLGSNLLVRDGGFPGAVICMQGQVDGLSHIDGGIYAQAGVTCAKVARYAARKGHEGGEFLAGIPGTMGGALAMNAGAYGGETWEFVERVETLDRHGCRRLRPASDFRVGYRSVAKPSEDEWFSAVWLRFPRGDGERSQRKIRELLAARSASQPTSKPTCGSVFRNPEGDYAARLIEQSGLKGFSIGGARISDKHSNFIVNEGHATAADIEALIQHVAEVVRKKTGVELQPEVRVVGEPA